jgi:hypothetical protein
MINRVASLVMPLLLMIVTAPSNVDAATLTVAWDPSTDAAVVGYKLAFGVSSAVYTDEIDVGAQTMYQVGNLTAGATYYFVVRAYDRYGNLSAPSREVMGVAPLGSVLSVVCPSVTVKSVDGSPVAVTFNATSSGGRSPVTTTCAPSSGSQFPVGTTQVHCTATDAAGITATCEGVVIVTFRSRHSE